MCIRDRLRYVGGCVRKVINKEAIDDIDLATNLKPNEVCEALKKNQIDYYETGIEHGTITALIDKQKYEITSLRKDVVTDGRHAKIEFSSNWKEDAERRDFSINSIYSDKNGNLFDPNNGKKDLEEGLINFIGDTENRIKDYFNSAEILVNKPSDLENVNDNYYDRVLITGFMKKVPSEIKFKVKEDGFILGPIGSIIHQRLIKKEKFGEAWVDTDLGGVVFGPLDIGDLEKNLLEPENLVEHMESALELILEVIEIEEESLNRINNLIWSLKNLPPGIPIVDEYSSEEEILENPVMELLLAEMEWLGPLWPILTGIDGLDIGNIESINSEYYSNTGGHEDLIP